MPALHLLKLCVGVASIADLQARIVQRTAENDGEQVHVTRVVPKRAAELLDGGSMVWVIRGQMAARQTLLDIRPFTDHDGVGRCRLVLEPSVIPVLSRRCKPFQGWRYLEEARRPPDLDGATGSAELPEALRLALRELCLL